MLFNFPKSTAYHEAGHAIAWTALTGHTPYAIHRGIFAVNTMPSSNPYMPMPDGLLGRDILYTLAGAAAQAKFQGKSFARIWQGYGCWGDQEHLDCWAIELTDELVKATQAILKPRWKLVDGLAKALLDNDGSMYGAELQEWCIQVEPHTDHDELLARLNKKMTSRKHKWFVRVEDDWNGCSSSPDHLTFFADDEEDVRDCLLGFVRHELDREGHGDEEIADFLEDVGVKVDRRCSSFGCQSLLRAHPRPSPVAPCALGQQYGSILLSSSLVKAAPRLVARHPAPIVPPLALCLGDPRSLPQVRETSDRSRRPYSSPAAAKKRAVFDRISRCRGVRA